MSLLVRIASSSISKYFIGWIFKHMSFAIPVKRLRETETVLAFYHPKPVYPVHILLMPKKAIASLPDLTDSDAPILSEVFKTAQSLVDELDLAQVGYRLILNGGEYQDVPHLHFHLVSGDQNSDADNATA